MFCAYIGPRYQVSVYRTIGPLIVVFVCVFTSLVCVIFFLITYSVSIIHVTFYGICCTVMNTLLVILFLITFYVL